ncbi:MAG: DUF6263 family protein [Bacteroidota bacterium]
MKRLIVYLLLAIVFGACSQQKEDKSKTQLDTTQSVNSNLITTPEADRVKLRYKFKRNDELNYKLTTISENNQQIEGDSTIIMNTSQNVNYLVNLKVKRIDENKNAVIDFTIRSIISEGTINGEKIIYDSKYIYSTQERIMFAQYEAIKRKTFTIIVSELGEIVDIKELDSIVDELIDIQQQKDKITADSRKQLISEFKEAALLPLSEQLFRQFPEEAVGINSNWEKRFNSKIAMFNVENVASFQIGNIETSELDTTAMISAGLSINWMGSHEATEQGVRYYFYDPVVSGSGLITFNNTTGLITHSETTTNMQLVMEMEGLDASQKPVKGKRTDNTTNKNIIELKL